MQHSCWWGKNKKKTELNTAHLIKTSVLPVVLLRLLSYQSCQQVSASHTVLSCLSSSLPFLLFVITSPQWSIHTSKMGEHSSGGDSGCGGADTRSGPLLRELRCVCTNLWACAGGALWGFFVRWVNNDELQIDYPGVQTLILKGITKGKKLRAERAHKGRACACLLLCS